MRRRLDDELGAIPSPELQAAHAAILRGETAIAARAARTNLPHARSSFVGREREVAELVRLLDEHRLVTLIGTGGSGKTRLAIEVARGRGGDAWIAELAAVTEPEHVTGAVLDALGLREARLLESQAPLPPDADERLVGAPQQRGEDADGGRLAGAVGTEQAQHRASPHGEVDPVERLRVPEALDEPSACTAMSVFGCVFTAPASDAPLARRSQRAHSGCEPQALRSATVGGIRDARTAGSRPANAPIRIAETMPPTHASAGITMAHVFELA